MCVIMHKPVNVAFPEEAILKNCWDNNPDMGGFMYTWNDKVYIKKGYKTWESFKNALNQTRKMTGDDIPYVCHFRISTQGYNTSCCQPFPLSEKMSRLKKSKTECNIGVAHNGILSITSDGALDYSDTMLFITDYLTNIIRSYDWYKDTRTCKLIENLISGSRFAILDKNGNCAMMGQGWVEDNGCFYSNSSYSYAKKVYTGYSGYWRNNSWNWDDDRTVVNKAQGDTAKVDSSKDKEEEQNIINYGDFELWDDYWDSSVGEYKFHETFCPYTVNNTSGYCSCCTENGVCSYTKCMYRAKA